MRLVDLLEKLQQPPGDLVDLALALEYKVRQLCAIASFTPLSSALTQSCIDDTSANKRIKVAQEIDIDAAITSISQLREFLDAYTQTLSANKHNARALASFTECIIISLTHLALTPAVFVDLQGEVGGIVDHREYVKTVASLLSPLLKHVLDNAAFVKRSPVNGGLGPYTFYGFSIFYALSALPLKKEAICAHHQGWYTIGRTLRDALRKMGSSSQGSEKMLKAADICATRPMAHNAEFGLKGAEAAQCLLQPLQSILQSLAGNDAQSGRQLIDSLLLVVPFMPDFERLIRKWNDTMKQTGEKRRHALTLYQLRSLGIVLCGKFKPIEKSLLTVNGDGLFKPLLNTSGHPGSDFDDLMFCLLGKNDGLELLQRCMMFLTADGITNICERVFANFDAKLWLSWTLALAVFPRQQTAVKASVEFPVWRYAENGKPETGRVRADDYKIQTLVLEPIVKQIQLQLQRRNHSGCEMIALLLCALCVVQQNPALWQSFAITHLQDITLHCVLNKFAQGESTLEVFGKPVTITLDPSEDIFELLSVYKAVLSETQSSLNSLAETFIKNIKTEPPTADLKINLVLDIFANLADLLGHSNIVNLSKIDLKKLPDLILVRFFELSIRLTSQMANSVPISSKMCAAVVKKITQYFVLIDKLNNKTLHNTYVAGLAQLLQVAFRIGSAAERRIRSEQAYLVLADSLISSDSQITRTFLSALLNTFVNNRTAFMAKPSDDAFLNILLYFFDDSRRDQRSPDVRLCNYRHSEVSPESFVDQLTTLLREVISAFCRSNFQHVPKTTWPKVLTFDSVGDPARKVKVAFLKEAKKVSAPAILENIEEGESGQSSPIQGEESNLGQFDAGGQERCQCADLLEWLRSCRKEVSSTLSLQGHLAGKLSACNGLEDAAKANCMVTTDECRERHQELFKMMCSIWCDIMRDGLLDPILMVEMLKFSPRLLGRNMGERQTSMVKALGLTLLGEEISYPLGGPNNQFDYRQLIEARKSGGARGGKSAKSLASEAVPEAADSKSVERRSLGMTRLWNVANANILFGDWLIEAVRRESKKPELSMTLSILLDLILYCSRMIYASVPLGNRPEKLLSSLPTSKTTEPLFESILRMLLPPSENSANIEPTAYPLLCEALKSVQCRRRFLSIFQTNKILNCLSLILTMRDPAALDIASECLEILRQLLGLEIYRERIFQIILNEKKPKLSNVIPNVFTICARIEFIRRNLITDDASKTLYLLRCVPQILAEADNGDWLFNDLVSSYRIIMRGAEGGYHVDHETHGILWEEAGQHSQSILRCCEAQKAGASIEDTLAQRRMTACLSGLALYLKPHN